MALAPIAMPPGTPGAAPAAPGAPPMPVAPPMGTSPATGPSQNLGLQAKALQGIHVAVNGLVALVGIGGIGANTELGRAVLKAVQDISRHLPPGSDGGMAGQANQMQAQLLHAQQMAPQMAALRAQALHQMAGGAAAPPPAAAA